MRSSTEVQYESNFALAEERLSEWRTKLEFLDSGSLGEAKEDEFLGVEIRAAAIIASMAETESVLRSSLKGAFEVINSSGATVNELIPSLRVLVMHESFESAVSTSKKKWVSRWDERIRLCSLADCRDVALIPVAKSDYPQLPLDGSTVALRHLTVIDRVLGLRWDPHSDVLLVTALKKLSPARNDLAHRNDEPSKILSQAGFGAKEVSKYIGDLLQGLVKYERRLEDYCAAGDYLVK